MPKPQHVDDKLYVNMVLLLSVFGFSCLFVLLLFGLHVHLQIEHFNLLNQPNEGK